MEGDEGMGENLPLEIEVGVLDCEGGVGLRGGGDRGGENERDEGNRMKTSGGWRNCLPLAYS